MLVREVVGESKRQTQMTRIRRVNEMVQYKQVGMRKRDVMWGGRSREREGQI